MGACRGAWPHRRSCEWLSEREMLCRQVRRELPTRWLRVPHSQSTVQRNPEPAGVGRFPAGGGPGGLPPFPARVRCRGRAALMIDSLRMLLENSPMLALFAVIGLGYALGQISIGGFSLGVGAVL